MIIPDYQRRIFVCASPAQLGRQRGKVLSRTYVAQRSQLAIFLGGKLRGFVLNRENQGMILVLGRDGAEDRRAGRCATPTLAA